jgi:peptidyl-tRNA hydrolase
MEAEPVVVSADVRPSMTGHRDPDGEAPWALQLVVRVERHEPPSVTAVYEAAAMAVVALLADDRSAPDGDWAPAVERWLDGRIRKLVRRARGAAWTKVQALPGVTVEHRGAQVRAFVPSTVDAVPTEISKTQLAGFALADAAAAPVPADAGWPGVVVAVNPTIDASPGKMAAQAAHASNLAWLGMDGDRRDAWRAAGFPVVVVHPDRAAWEAFVAAAPVLVVDAGFTEIPPGSATTAARWT